MRITLKQVYDRLGRLVVGMKELDKVEVSVLMHKRSVMLYKM
jgi:hypothetical protein